MISEASETGWIATETLAGSRLRTNFKDVPNQIETLTKDFMDDLGVNTIDQALIYTANVENYTDFMPQSAYPAALGGGRDLRPRFPASIQPSMPPLIVQSSTRASSRST